MRVGVIDLGTNSARLFIYDISSKGTPRKRHRQKIAIRLGENLFAGGKFDPKAFQRAVAAFDDFKKTIDTFAPDEVRAVATSAMREAADREDLIAVIAERTGIKIQVISGAEEARLIALGITTFVDLPNLPLILLDLGGGSAEVTLCTGKIVHSGASLPLGAARGQQLYLQTQPPKDGGIEALRAAVRKELAKSFSKLPWPKADLAIGSSGSLRSFSEWHHRVAWGRIFPRSFLQEQIETVKNYSREQIAALPGIEVKRADLMLAAAVVLPCRE